MRKLMTTMIACGALLAAACGDDPDNTNAGGSGGSGGSAGSGGRGGSAGSGGSAGTGGSAGAGGSAGTGGRTPDARAADRSRDLGALIDGRRDGGSTDAGSAAVPPEEGAPCPRCVRAFNGVNFDGWEAGGGSWTIVNGAMRGSGGSSRAAYTKKDYGNVRYIVTSRMNPVNGDHLGTLFWGQRPTDPNRPKIDNNGWLQWMPPNGGMWSYQPPMHHGISGMKLANGPGNITQWHTSEVLLNIDKGTLRAATDGVEITRYTHPWPSRSQDPNLKLYKGPIGMMKHGGGGSEYKDIWIEEDPTEDKLYTVR
jgi:hypothetical protein